VQTPAKQLQRSTDAGSETMPTSNSLATELFVLNPVVGPNPRAGNPATAPIATGPAAINDPTKVGIQPSHIEKLHDAQADDTSYGSLKFGAGILVGMALALAGSRGFAAASNYLKHGRQRARPVVASASTSRRTAGVHMNADGKVGCVGIVGSSGAVGKEMLTCLEERKFPTENIRLFANRAAGDTVTTKFGDVVVEKFSVEAGQECDILLMAVSGDFSKEFGPQVVGGPKNTVVIDNSSAWRYDKDTPLVIPEINGNKCTSSLIANPNCTTAIGAMPLWPLHQKYKLKKVIMSTYQAASGAGAEGMAELEEGISAYAKDGKVGAPKVFAHQLPFNVIPQIDAFQGNGYTKEEMKVAWELQKIFGLPDEVKISCTSVRVPTLRAHSEAIVIETELPIDPDEARELLRSAPGVEVVDDPENLKYPMPLNASGEADVQVGRIRQSLIFGKNGLEFFVSGDQLLRGAALNAVIIAEETVKSPLSDSVPLNGPVPWGMHKFGGASLADADLYRTVGGVLMNESTLNGSKTPTAAVVSAMKGMTDQLVGVVETATKPDGVEEAKERLKNVVKSHIDTANDLLGKDSDLAKQIVKNITADGADINALLTSTALLKTVPNSTMELVAGMGEIWSAQLLSGYLKSKGAPATWLNARDVLIVEASDSGVGAKGAAVDAHTEVIYGETERRLDAWWESNNKALKSDKPPILVITGFVATTEHGVPTTLKRSGSDFSATIFAKLFQASSVTMWKNTDGVFRADPGVVEDPESVTKMSYDEAVELAYFGGQVLHPSSMTPVIAASMPVYVRNIFNTAFAGTKISHEGDPDAVVQVVTSIPKIAMVTIDGGSYGSVSSVTVRAMSALDRAGVKVVLVTQGSASHSLAVAVDENEGPRAAKAIEDAFELELARGQVDGVKSQSGYSILSIVGEDMKGSVGTMAKLSKAVASVGGNIVCIAQGSSETSISLVLEQAELDDAMRAVHCEFTGQKCTLDYEAAKEPAMST
jgi:aspartate-semialdehyde dehydrogenase